MFGQNKQIENYKSNKFFRKGTSGDWETLFSHEDLEQFTIENADAMKLIGYDSIMDNK